MKNEEGTVKDAGAWRVICGLVLLMAALVVMGFVGHPAFGGLAELSFVFMVVAGIALAASG